MQKRTKKIIILTILILIVIAIILLIVNTNKQIPLVINEQAKATYTTEISDKTYDITNAVLNPSHIIPTLSAGMIPVKWNGTSWVITTADDKGWYDYTNGQPAYIMLNDGTYQSELIRDMTDKKLAEDNVKMVIDSPDNLGTIYMWLPRIAYNDVGDILYIKQGYTVDGTYKIPAGFSYKYSSIAGIWIEYNSIQDINELVTKMNDMSGEDNQYGFIANTIVSDVSSIQSYQNVIEMFISKCVGDKNQTFSILNEPTNNRTILRVVNEKKKEPIIAEATFNKADLKINIEVTYRTNAISKILDEYGNILSENSTSATDTRIIGNGIYNYFIIDNIGNIRKISISVSGITSFIIPDLETLKLFRDRVNAGNDFAGVTVLQTADIAMNEGKYTIDEETNEITFEEDAEQWTPIGNYSNKFCGSYDGGEHTISGIYIKNGSYQGLFGYIDNTRKRNGTIQNLNVEKSKIDGGNYIGGIVGYAKVCNIKKCNFDGKVNGGTYVGGIVGYADAYSSSNSTANMVIENCSNVGMIKGHQLVGGIIGYAKSNTTKDCNNKGKIIGTGNYVGGIVSYVEDDIENCYNNGEIIGNEAVGGIMGYATFANEKIVNSYNIGTVSGNKNIGGISGMVVGNGVNYSSVENCYNKGMIIGKDKYTGGITGQTNYAKVLNSYNSGTISGKQATGGIVGEQYMKSERSNIQNCYNIGTVSGTTEVGGIVGYRSYNTDSVSEKIEYCYNAGTITGNGRVGGIVGHNRVSRATVEYCYNLGNVKGTSESGAIVGGLSTSVSGISVVANCYYVSTTASVGIGENSASTPSKQYTYTATKSSIISRITALSEYKADSSNINGGHPILSWQ